ncbi:hypothetical protein DICA4_F13256 [Diutina catenulata]
MPSLDVAEPSEKKQSRLSHLARPQKPLLTKPLPDSPSLTRTQSRSSQLGYHLQKADTQMTLDSENYVLEQQYRVRLQLTQKEIDLLRYTWNKMLLDEPITQPKSVFPQMPGAFAATLETRETRPTLRQTSSSTVASSLFCRQLYSNLLTMKPEYARMFPSIHHQAVSFAGVISFAISQLERLDAIDQYLCNLGKRHSRILGIEPEMFETLGEALIDTFHGRFGIRFTQELEVLWIQLYMYLANSLLQFGMDPHINLDAEQPSSAPSIKKSTRTVSILSDNDSLMEESSKRGSVFTTSTSASVTVDHTGKPSLASALPPLPKDESNFSSSVKTKIKKRKRDCVIM